MSRGEQDGGGKVPDRKSRFEWEFYTCGAVFLAGLFLRFFYLGKESIWLDEVLSHQFAGTGWIKILKQTAADIHPPLYYWVLHPFLYLGSREEILRLPSCLFGSLTVPVLYLAGRELWGRKTGFLAALFLALSPFHLFYSQEARMYTLFLFWVCLATYLLILALDRKRARYWVGYSLAMVLSLYTHYFTFFILLAQNIYVVIHCFRMGGEENSSTYRVLKNLPGLGPLVGRFRESSRWDFLARWIFSQGLIILLFLPWLPVLYAQYTSGKGDWILRYFGSPGFRQVIETIRVFGTGPARIGIWLGAPSFLFLALAFRGLFTRGKGGEVSPAVFTGLCFFLPLLVVFLASQIKPAYQIKYLIGVYPFYLFLVAAGVEAFRWKGVRAVLVSVLLLSFVIPIYAHYKVRRGAAWREKTRTVIMGYLPGDVVGFNAAYIDRIFWYYRDLNFQGKEIAAHRFGMMKGGEKELPRLEREVRKLKERYSRLWLVQSHQWDTDPEGLVLWYLANNCRVLAKDPGAPELYLFDLKAGPGIKFEPAPGS